MCSEREDWMIRTITRRLLLVLALVALAQPLAAAPPAGDADAPPALEMTDPLAQFWTAFQKVFGLDSGTSSPPLGDDPEVGPYIDPYGATEPKEEAGPYIDPLGASGEDGGEAGPLIDPHG